VSTEPWHIQMLGGLVLRRGGESVSNFPTEKSRLLLAYLAAYLPLTPTREELVERFWPDSDIDAGRVSLRQALAQVRRILEPAGVAPSTFLIADRSKVCLNAEFFVTDVANWDRSRALANRAEGSERLRLLEAALPYYGGEFVPGAYMEWVLQERQHRQDQYVDLLLHLADAQMEHGRYMAARESAQLVLRTDAFDEEAHDRLIRAFALEGNLVLARRQYDKLCKLLRDELSLDPSPRLQALYAGLEQFSRSRPEAENLPGASSSSPRGLSAPASLPAETPRLPLRLTRFFGRTEELRQLQEWLNDPALRLITLTGIGGIGKTRLSIEAAQLSTRFGASITFVPLSETPLPELLLPAILQNLCLPAFTPTDSFLRLRDALGAQSHLLVLDNFEQIAETAAETLWQLLEQVPTIACLITSRQPLNLPGEHELALAPLPVPDSRWTADNLIDNPTVQLLVDRIQASRPDFHITSANAASVAALCTRLEGIPLAVELASGWARDLTIAQMQERMSQRFHLLVSRQRGVPPRHQSLRATVESSFQLLSPPLQRFFLRLSVFCGGWCAEAAQIGEDQEDRSASVLEQDGLRVLREQSLITVQEVQDHVRYGMLETLREFAWEQLPPPEQEHMRRRHASYWMTFGEEIELKLNGPELRDWQNRQEEERANLTAALTWCLEAPAIDDLSPSPVEIGLRIVGALWKFWDIRGSVQEGLQFTERLLKRAPAEIASKILARAHATGGALAKADSNYPAALAHGEQSLLHWRLVGSLEGICSALSNTGMYLSELGRREEALRYYEEGLALMRELGIDWRTAIFLNNIGSLQRQMGDFGAAQANLQEALALRRQIGDLRAIWSTLNNLAALAHHQDDYAAAVRNQQEALSIARELEDRYAIGISLVNLGGNYLSLEDLPSAYRCFTESLQLHTAVASRFGQAYALEGLATHAALTDCPERAGVLLGATQALREAIQAKPPPQEQELMDAPFLPFAADPLFLDGLMRGRTLPLEAVIALAAL
jgi:predicted ATPase/DNA-binding SARP family transcriptional activator